MKIPMFFVHLLLLNKLTDYFQRVSTQNISEGERVCVTSCKKKWE